MALLRVCATVNTARRTEFRCCEFEDDEQLWEVIHKDFFFLFFCFSCFPFLIIIVPKKSFISFPFSHSTVESAKVVGVISFSHRLFVGGRQASSPSTSHSSARLVARCAKRTTYIWESEKRRQKPSEGKWKKNVERTGMENEKEYKKATKK